MKSPTSVRGVAVVVAVALPLAACGSSSPTSSVSSASAASKQASAVAFANCMRANGVPNFPDPSSKNGGGLQIQQADRSGSGGSASVNGVPLNGRAFQSAMQKCRSKLPNAGHLPPGGIAALRRQALRFAKCMRAHGISNFPDPHVASGPGGGAAIRIGGPNSGINPKSPAFQAAQRACASIMGKAPGPPTAGAP